jgi:hypothetical protein
MPWFRAASGQRRHRLGRAVRLGHPKAEQHQQAAHQLAAIAWSSATSTGAEPAKHSFVDPVHRLS